MGVMYGGSVGLGYLKAVSSGSATVIRFTILNNGNDIPTSTPPKKINECLFFFVAQYAKSSNIADGSHTGVTVKSYGYPSANHAPLATHVYTVIIKA